MCKQATNHLVSLDKHNRNTINTTVYSTSLLPGVKMYIDWSMVLKNIQTHFHDNMLHTPIRLQKVELHVV